MINLSEGFSPTADSSEFEPGDVVVHIRYSYRGVVVNFDKACQAPEDWYKSNQTQPDREQPWYHILVDGKQQVTYVAQSNLRSDKSKQQVVHGMINLFFRATIRKTTNISAIKLLESRQTARRPPSTPHLALLLHHLLLHQTTSLSLYGVKRSSTPYYLGDHSSDDLS